MLWIFGLLIFAGAIWAAYEVGISTAAGPKDHQIKELEEALLANLKQSNRGKP